MRKFRAIVLHIFMFILPIFLCVCFVSVHTCVFSSLNFFQHAALSSMISLPFRTWWSPSWSAWQLSWRLNVTQHPSFSVVSPYNLTIPLTPCRPTITLTTIHITPLTTVQSNDHPDYPAVKRPPSRAELEPNSSPESMSNYQVSTADIWLILSQQVVNLREWDQYGHLRLRQWRRGLHESAALVTANWKASCFVKINSLHRLHFQGLKGRHCTLDIADIRVF